MKNCRYVTFFLIFLALALFLNQDLNAATIDPVPAGHGSLPARIFANGMVCMVDMNNPSVCQKKLVRLPREATKAHSATFYGVFDLDNDGSPEVFAEYWSPSNHRNGDNIVLLVYKKIRGKYKQYLKLKAESLGYSPGAWFLNELPYPKVVLMTRYGGSSGAGLFYLDLKKKSLDLISGPVFLEGKPEFLDMDGDGMTEIFLPGRGRDRTSQPGAAVLHWKDDGYQMWWPNWTGVPAVIYATLADIDKDGKKEIIAVLEPQKMDFAKHIDGETAAPRELALWKVTAEGPALLSKTKLPDASFLSDPTIGFVPPLATKIELEYRRTVGCVLQGGEMTCREEK
jgi:hypothetical protein